MRVLIIEDEMGALDDLRSILAESAPDIRIARTTESVMQSVAWLEKNPVPDLIFMDIHLSDGSAFEIFQAVRPVEAPGDLHDRLRRVRHPCLQGQRRGGYLLKPLAIDEVKRALEKYRRLNRPQVLPDIEKLYEMISCQRTNSRRNILVAYKGQTAADPDGENRLFLFDQGDVEGIPRRWQQLCLQQDAGEHLRRHGSPGILPGQQTIRRRQGAHHEHRRMVEQPPAGFDGYRDARARIPEQKPGCGVQKMDHGISPVPGKNIYRRARYPQRTKSSSPRVRWVWPSAST